MKSIAFFFSLLFSYSLVAQEDIMSVLAELNKKQELVTDISSVTETTYGTFTMEEDAKPDTIIEYNGQEVELYVSNKTIRTYKSPTEVIEESFKKDERIMQTTTKLHEDGRFISMSTEMSGAAAFMNSLKEYHYDDQDRIVSVFENGAEIMNIKYDGEGYPAQMSMEAMFGKISITAEQLGDITRYNMGIDMASLDDEEGGEFAKMLAEKMAEGPREYIELKKEKERNIVSGFKEIPETEKAFKQWENRRDKNYQLLSEKKFNESGELLHHQEYTYHETGKILETKNMLDGTSKTNEFDDSGNMVIEHEFYMQSRHIYDDKGNLIVTIQTAGEEGDIMTYIVREIEYR